MHPKSLQRRIAGACMMIMALTAAVPLRAAEETGANETKNEQELKRVTGTVAKVSFIHSTIMLTCDLGYITFYVPDTAVIMRGSDAIDLDELKTEETITIQYSHPSPSQYIAVYIRSSKQVSE